MEECLGGVGMELPVTEGGKLSGMDVVVEESGPVKYCGDDDLEELGMDDREMEQLAYEGDPLLNSDYEDEGTRQSCCVAYYNYIATLLFR